MTDNVASENAMHREEFLAITADLLRHFPGLHELKWRSSFDPTKQHRYEIRGREKLPAPRFVWP